MMIVDPLHNQVQHRLAQAIKQGGNSDDPFLALATSMPNNTEHLVDNMTSKASMLKEKLDHQMKLEQEACQEESERLLDLQNSIADLQKRRSALHQEIEELEHYQGQLQEKIATYQEEASDELERLDQVEEERKRHVPRLKTQLSLYASTTGIKWDYTSSTLLAGQVAIPSRKAVKKFSLDPRDFSQHEIANHLWNLIEGKDD